MNQWLLFMIILVSGMIIGIIYCHAASLIAYIRKMDEEELVCDTCSNRKTCIAVRPIGNSNWVTEFTYTTYWLVRKKCMYGATIGNPWKQVLIFAILNSILYEGIFLIYGFGTDMVLYCLATTVLLYIGIVDWNTQYIPAEFNIIIFLLGLIRLCLNPSDWVLHVIGLFAVSVFLLLVDWIGTRIWQGNHVVGGGDIKLMAAAGLLLGWKLNIVAFMMGCVCGSIIHLIIMKIGKGEHKLAFGPYLALGIYIAMICGEQLVSWYLGIMGL